MKDSFRKTLNDDSKSTKSSSKTNADCDKIKGSKSESHDPNGKRIDALSEPTKKKQKRSRDDKNGDGPNLSTSVSITPIASSNSYSGTGLSSSSSSSKLGSSLNAAGQNLSQDWPQQHQQQVSFGDSFVCSSLIPSNQPRCKRVCTDHRLFPQSNSQCIAWSVDQALKSSRYPRNRHKT